MNHDTNNHLDDQFMTALQETVPAAQKEQLKAKLNQIQPETGWWRLRNMKHTANNLGRSNTLPRLAGVMALVAVAAVTYFFLNNPTTLSEQETVNKINLDDAVEVATIGDITYKWAAGEYPTVPDTLPRYTYASAYPESVAEQNDIAAQIGINDPTTYLHNTFGGGMGTIRELRGDNGRSVIFLDDFQEMTYKDNPELQDRFTPLSPDAKIAMVEQFVTTYSAWGAADDILIEPDGKTLSEYGQQWVTFTPQIIVPNVTSPIPIYSNMFYRALASATLGSDGTVAEVRWSAIQIKKTDKTDEIIPAIDALNTRGRHSTSTWTPAGRDYTHRNENPFLYQLQDGDDVSLRGQLDIIVNEITGEESSVLYLAPQILLRLHPLDVEIIPVDIGSAQVNGVFREQENGYVIEVTSWEKISNAGCRQGTISQLDPVIFSVGRPETTYTVPDAPADLKLNDLLDLCADDWSNDEVDWHELQRMKPAVENASDDTERIITAARLIYKMEDFLGNTYADDLKLFWEFTGLNEEGGPFTVYVRAD